MGLPEELTVAPESLDRDDCFPLQEPILQGAEREPSVWDLVQGRPFRRPLKGQTGFEPIQKKLLG